jgi:hypothetical protein
MVRSAVWLAALFLIASPGTARAEATVSEAAKNLVGLWEISNVDRDRRCPLSFSLDPAPGGYKVEFDPECTIAFTQLASVVAWGFGAKDTLQLLNAKGAAVMEFTEVESGMFESERGQDGLLFLQTQAAVKAETRSAEQVFGDWNLMREADKPLCRLTLSNAVANTASEPESYRVVVRPGCDKTIATFAPATWRLDRDQLLLAGRGGTWRFSESGATVWERVPLTVEPLLLVRQ